VTMAFPVLLDAVSPDATRCDIGRLRIERLRAGRERISVRAAPDALSPGYDLVFPCGGPIHFRQGDRDGTARPGEYVLFECRRLYEIQPQGADGLLRLSLPGADLESRYPSLEECLTHRFDQNTQMAGLLYGVLEMLTATFADAPPPNPEALATEIASLVVLVLGSEERGDMAAGRSSRYRLKSRIIEFIDSNLDDIDLSPRKIASANRISLSYLYNLFCDNDMTVSRLIQARRLQKAYEILLSDTRGAMLVSEVAYQVGFKNPSHFSRIFSQRYQVAPRYVREQRLSSV